MPSVESELKVISFQAVSPAVGLVSTGWTRVEVDTGVRPRPTGDGAAVTALDSIVVRVSSIAGSAASLTAKITADTDGDIPLGPVSSAATLVVGETTATEGAATFDGQQVIISVDGANAVLSDDGTWIVYLWLRTNTGTCDVDSVRFGSRP